MPSIDPNILVLQNIVKQLIELTGKKDELTKTAKAQYVQPGPGGKGTQIQYGFKEAVEMLGLSLD
jgi:hypothetical protein